MTSGASVQQLVTRAMRSVLALATAALCCSAIAAPDAASDTVSQFLHDRGFVDAAALGSAEPSLIDKVRDRASDLVITALNFLDLPYRRGGVSPDSGFDCSGFTRHIFEMSLGLVLPRRSDQQASAPGLVSVKRDELKPGDLVFFNTLKRSFSHVGIYVGEDKFIHSPRSGSQVRVEDMRYSYWAKRYTGARRAPEPEAAPAASAQGAPLPRP